MLKYVFLILLAVAGVGYAQPSPLSGTQTTLGAALGSACGVGTPCAQAIATPLQQIAPRTNAYTYFQAFSKTTVASGTYANGSGGHAFLYSIELEDDYGAVQLVFANATATPYTVGQVVVSSSSEWGGGPNNGVTPYDVNGIAVTTMLPVTFNSAGANSLAFPAAGNGYSATVQGGPEATLALSTSASTASGNNTLTFASTVTAGTTGGASPGTGWYITDGLGCIAPGTTISAITSTTITMSANATGSGCASGQQIWFSRAPININGITVPGTANAPSPSLVVSDWIPVSSLPRIDGPVVPGMAVSGSANVPAGTLTTAPITAQAFGISNALTGTITGNTTLTLSLSYTTSAAVPAGFIVPMASVANLHPGMAAAGSGIAANTTVLQVCGAADCSTPIGGSSYVRLSTPISSALSSGESLTFSQPAVVINSASAGATSLAVSSTTNKRLLLVRGYINSGAATVQTMANNQPNFETVNYGFPLPVFRMGPQSTGTAVDCVNFVSTCGTVGPGVYAYGGSPIYAIRYIGAHRGIQVAAVGDSHMQGTSTGSGNASYVRLATNAISSLALPVAVENVAIGGNQGQQYFPFLYNFLQLTQPGIVVMQGITGNGQDTPASYLTQMQGLVHYITGYGGRVIYTTDFPRRSRTLGNLVVAQDVNNSTTVPLNIVLPDNNAGTVSGVAITGTGIQAGTTASLTRFTSSITLSQAATIPAGTVLTLGVVTASTTSGSSSATMTTPSYFAGTFDVSGTNIPAGCEGTVAVNATLLALTCNATGTGTTTVTIGGDETPSQLITQQGGIANVMNMLGAAQAVSLFDSYSILENPSDPTYYLPAYTLDGLHADDYGHATMGTALKTVLQHMIGN